MTSVEKAPGAEAPALEDALAALCKASSDPLRLQVLRVLRNDSFGVSELCYLFDIRQPALSHHLKVLAGAGLVATRREGNSIFYRRSELGQRPLLEALQDSLFATLDRMPLPAAVEQRQKSQRAGGQETLPGGFGMRALGRHHRHQRLLAVIGHLGVDTGVVAHPGVSAVGAHQQARRQRGAVFQLDALAVTAEELPELQAERQKLLNSGKLAEGVATALGALNQDDAANAGTLLAEASRSVAALCAFDAQLKPVGELLESAGIQVSEAIDELQREHATDILTRATAAYSTILS